MRCLCGSGKLAKNCHGNQIDNKKMRKMIKYDVLNVDSHKIYINAIFNPLRFGRQTLKCKLIYQLCTTPAGEILYPLFIIKDNKAIRPITIDGLAYERFNGKVIQYIHCMLTPVSRGLIVYETKNINIDEHHLFYVQCHVYSDGNPFQSIFAIDSDGYNIKLYHHTSSYNAYLIHQSMVLKASKWNLQGTSELSSIHHIYLTDLDLIQDIFDLIQIGMSDKGTNILFGTDDEKEFEEVEVYREEKNQRESVLHVWLHPGMITPTPLILHDPQHYSDIIFSWWEVFHSSIFRIPVKPFSDLPLMFLNDNEYVLCSNNNLLPRNQFNAAHGNDMISMKHLMSEPLPSDHPRNLNPKKCDKGLLDPDWISTWNKNLSVVAYNMVLGNSSLGPR